jgi:hypothetical protein
VRNIILAASVGIMSVAAFAQDGGAQEGATAPANDPLASFTADRRGDR